MKREEVYPTTCWLVKLNQKTIERKCVYFVTQETQMKATKFFNLYVNLYINTSRKNNIKIIHPCINKFKDKSNRLRLKYIFYLKYLICLIF